MLGSNKNATRDHQISMYASGCRSGKYAPHVHPEEALNVQYPCADRGRAEIVTCCDRGIEKDIEDVGGLDMLEVKLRGTSIVLPQYIPVIPRGMFNHLAQEVPHEIVGVTLNDILTQRIYIGSEYCRLPKGSRIDTNILSRPIFEGKQVILFSSGRDALLEPLWANRDQTQLLPTLASMGFMGIVGMNFSVFLGECPFGHALNLKKSLCYSRNLDEFGVWSIPHVYAINRFQRERWVNWLLANPGVQVIGINTQLQKSRFDLQNVMETVVFLLENTTVEIILHGRGVELLRSGFPLVQTSRLHFASSHPLFYSLIRRERSAAEYIDETMRTIMMMSTASAKKK